MESYFFAGMLEDIVSSLRPEAQGCRGISQQWCDYVAS